MPDKKLDAKADAEKLRPKMSKEMSEKARARERQKLKAREIKYAKEMFAQGVSRSQIAKQLGRSRVTIGKWVKDEPDPNKLRQLEEEKAATEDLAQKELENTTGAVVGDIEHEMIDARTEEEQALLEMAKEQSTPADQYQAYIASKSIKLLRDSFAAVRPPRTIAELDRLDQIVRRSMGLNAKGLGGGGSGSQTLQIDINLLNNHKATLPTGQVIDAETTDE